MKTSYDECPFIATSFAWKNFNVNMKYNKTFSTDFRNPTFDLDQYVKYMEFLSLYEFNRIKGKEFIPYPSFSKVYNEANQDANMPLSRTDDLV